tara:strand:- start:1487 stop:2191 length:705 start_codon:yes stop_codon:yes gene_type:complete
MTLMTIVNETDLGFSATPEGKLEYFLRRASFTEANKFLKESNRITRFKGMLSPRDFFSEKYDRLIYKLYNILFSEFKSRVDEHLASSGREQGQVRVQKNRGRKSLTMHVPFYSNEIAVAFQSQFAETLPTDRLGYAWSRPLVYYNSRQAVLNYDYGCSNFYPRPFVTLPDESRSGVTYTSLPSQLRTIEELFYRLNALPNTLIGVASEEEISQPLSSHSSSTPQSTQSLSVTPD